MSHPTAILEHMFASLRVETLERQCRQLQLDGWQNHIDVVRRPRMALRSEEQLTLSGSRRAGGADTKSTRLRLHYIPVDRIRPEEGLGRKRDREGHRELCRSIEQFGVLTPITVRRAPDGSEDYLLIKGQGRTLACRMLGIEKIPALVVTKGYAETEKVQQFLVENVARLKLSAVDRALLISHARREGEET